MANTAYASGEGTAPGTGFGTRIATALGRAFAALSRAREAEAERKTREILRSLGVAHPPAPDGERLPRH